eukprot:1502469-Amphidinium_carterae.5
MRARDNANVRWPCLAQNAKQSLRCSEIRMTPSDYKKMRTRRNNGVLAKYIMNKIHMIMTSVFRMVAKRVRQLNRLDKFPAPTLSTLHYV